MEILSKSHIRTNMKHLRNNLKEQEEASMNSDIFAKLIDLEVMKQAECVYCYMDCRHEADTGKLLEYLWEQGVKTAVPKMEGKSISFYYIESMNDVIPGCMGILEPSESAVRACDTEAVTILPGLAFDKRGHRIGYGGGYYDRFLESEPNHFKIGIAYGFQVMSKVPYEDYDIRMDLIVTPETIYAEDDNDAD